MARQLMTNQRGKSIANLLVWQNAHVDGNAFYNSPRTVLVVQCGAGALALTIARVGAVDGLTLTAKVLNLLATELHLLKFDPSIYNQSDGTVYLNTDVQTGVKFAAIEV